MSQIERAASNTPWEPIFGYVRKVRAGNWLAISGTTATDERGMIVGKGQMYVQARQALLNIKHHVESSGFSLRDLVRTRVFVTDISRFAEVARAHKEVMGEYPPAATCVEVIRLVHPDMLIEIEADAFADGESGTPRGTDKTAQAKQSAVSERSSAVEVTPPHPVEQAKSPWVSKKKSPRRK